MMRVYALTSLGRRIAATKYDNTDEFSVLSYLKDNKTATSDELGTIGISRFTLRRLKGRGLITELTR